MQEILKKNGKLKLSSLKPQEEKINKNFLKKHLSFSLPFDLVHQVHFKEIDDKFSGVLFFFDSHVKCKVSVQFLHKKGESFFFDQQKTFFFNAKQNQKFELSNFVFKTNRISSQAEKKRAKSQQLSERSTKMKGDQTILMEKLGSFERRKIFFVLKFTNLSQDPEIKEMILLFDIVK